jgi:hypothetical protein
VLEIDDWRVSRWIRRRAEDRLADLVPGGNPVHGLLEWEVTAMYARHGQSLAGESPVGRRWCRP